MANKAAHTAETSQEKLWQQKKKKMKDEFN